MAIIVQYVVVREGIEKMTFTSKKEADSYDKLLDVAENLSPFLKNANLELNDAQLEKLAFYLATNKDQLASLLKGNKSLTSTDHKTAKSSKKLSSVSNIA